MDNPRRNGAAMIRLAVLWVLMGCAEKGSDSATPPSSDPDNSGDASSFRRIAVVETSSGKLLVTNNTDGQIEG